MTEKRGLGRGLDSLIPTQGIEQEFDVTSAPAEGAKGSVGETVREVPVEMVDPNPHQPRMHFDETELQALAASIRVHGILQPLVMSKVGNRYELIAGERRLRAAKIAGFDTVPAIVRSFDEQQKLELAIIENIQRAELNPIELGTAYRKLVDQFNQSIREIANKVGRDESTISNSMRLLNLPIEAKRAVAEGKITEGHARVILSLEEDYKRDEMLKLMLKKGWTIRQAEEYARGWRGPTGSKMKALARIQATNQLTMELGDVLGAKVTQQRTAKGGKLIIEYYSEEELDRIYKVIRREE